MISGEQLQHVPGCENGDAPYSQELLGGGKVNRSFLVRTRRGRFVVRLNENTDVDPGLDRAREIALHTVAAGAGIAPHIIYACPSHTFPSSTIHSAGSPRNGSRKYVAPSG